MRTLKMVCNDAESEPVAFPPLETFEDVQLAQAVESVRRARVETERAEEVVKEFGFRRIVLIVVLCILALVALGSLAAVLTGIAAGAYSLAAGAVVPLSSSGGLSVLAWRTYTGHTPLKPVGDWAQGGGSSDAGSKPS